MPVAPSSTRLEWRSSSCHEEGFSIPRQRDCHPSGYPSLRRSIQPPFPVIPRFLRATHSRHANAFVIGATEYEFTKHTTHFSPRYQQRDSDPSGKSRRFRSDGISYERFESHADECTIITGARLRETGVTYYHLTTPFSNLKAHSIATRTTNRPRPKPSADCRQSTPITSAKRLIIMADHHGGFGTAAATVDVAPVTPIRCR